MSKTKERIHDSNLRYKQGLGQNFIYDEDLLAALVASSEITKEDRKSTRLNSSHKTEARMPSCA